MKLFKQDKWIWSWEKHLSQISLKIKFKFILKSFHSLSFQMHIMLSVLIPFPPMYRRTYLLNSYPFIDYIENHYRVLLTVLTIFSHFWNNLPFSPAWVKYWLLPGTVFEWMKHWQMDTMFEWSFRIWKFKLWLIYSELLF